MPPPDPVSAVPHTPVAVVWCRQVDNEAESPGYTTIPDDFPGRRETLEAIRIVGNLTVNVADTHDYWDPDPSQPLSYYPNLFLYPACGGRYTCVGRMFLSTEDRPRIGMKTLVFETAPLLASGEFGAAVLRAHGTMGGRAEPPRPSAEPDSQVYNGVGEGFLFHRGSTEPVILVASDQWETTNQVVKELVRLLPASLVAMGAFLVFPYFLPVAKLDVQQMTEQLPLALAVMRVSRAEAQGDRHAKRVEGWSDAPVTLRDLTKPSSPRAKETFPLVLQYVRDHAEDKLGEIARRVDLVEGPRLKTLLADADRQSGRDRRKEMWRIGTAMETAALLLSRPRGRSVSVSGELAKRANEYVKAAPRDSQGGTTAAGSVAAPLPELTSVSALPPWLQRPTEVSLPDPGSVGVPVSIQSDPSLLPIGSPSMPPSLGSVDTAAIPTPLPSAPPPPPPPPVPGPSMTAPANGAAVEARMQAALRDSEAKWKAALDSRVQQVSTESARALSDAQRDTASRLTALEARPSFSADALSADVERRLRASPDPRLAEIPDRVQQAVKASGEAWTAAVRTELKQWSAEMSARAARSEEELRAALATQLDLELTEAKEQGSALREEIEGRVRGLIDGRFADLEQKRVRDVRELEQRLGLLLEGRTKDLESRVSSQLSAGRAALDERVVQVTKRLEIDREARLSEMSETHSKSLAGLQVRMQSYLDQKIREDQENERQKYVELLARLRAEVDDSIQRTIESPRFDAAVKGRITTALHEAETRLQSQQGPGLARVEGMESRLLERESDIARLEEQAQRDAEDLDRRLQVLSDKMLPLVRKTWVRIEELEKSLGGSEDQARQFAELRRDIGRELRRVETELRDDAAELRQRLEATVTSQGKIWLNLVRQMSESGAGYVPSEEDTRRERSRRGGRRPVDPDDADLLGRPRSRESPFAEFDEDPANPLDPRPPAEDDTRPPPRRSSGRAPRGGGQS